MPSKLENAENTLLRAMALEGGEASNAALDAIARLGEIARNEMKLRDEIARHQRLEAESGGCHWYVFCPNKPFARPEKSNLCGAGGGYVTNNPDHVSCGKCSDLLKQACPTIDDLDLTRKNPIGKKCPMYLNVDGIFQFGKKEKHKCSRCGKRWNARRRDG